MSVFEFNLLHDPVNTLLTIVACVGFTCIVLGTIFMAIGRFFLIIFGGFKAIKGIKNELIKK